MDPSPPTQQQSFFRIAMVCDFFYPRLGGVEMHIWSLSQQLLRLGHKVIIITHAYDKRTGVRYMSSGNAANPLKVYYCPLLPMTDEDTMPTFLVSLPIVRWILIRESIQIVHAHQATSVLANESLVYGNAMGLITIYTDHSLFAFNDVASVILNRVLQVTLSTTDMAIGVSHACRDNLILRAKLNPSRVRVIPNAVDASKFTPDPSKRSPDRINIVVVSRLVYRKGVDLLVGIIPKIILDSKFSGNKEIHFIIAGDGNKMLSLQEMVEYHRLQESVTFLGAVSHNQVRDVLCQGDIFLNCSLTESFCIAILEAACCGLMVVSTNVGGIPEVLPPDMILLSPPTVPAMVQQLKQAIIQQHQEQEKQDKTQQDYEETKEKVQGDNADNSGSSSNSSSSMNSPENDTEVHGDDTTATTSTTTTKMLDPFEKHKRIKNMYSWHRVCLETVKVYEDVMKKREDAWKQQQQQHQQQSQETTTTESFQIRYHRSTVPQFLNRLSTYYYSVGGFGFSSFVVCLIVVTFELWLSLVEWFQPKDKIDVVPLLVTNTALSTGPTVSQRSRQS